MASSMVAALVLMAGVLAMLVVCYSALVLRCRRLEDELQTVRVMVALVAAEDPVTMAWCKAHVLLMQEIAEAEQKAGVS